MSTWMVILRSWCDAPHTGFAPLKLYTLAPFMLMVSHTAASGIAVLGLLAAAAVFLFRGQQRLRRSRKEAIELRRQLARSEMQALRSQMNPHFIFNAINSIQHYVLTNEKELANKYLVKFSRLMRNILELSSEELISLMDEFDTARLYMEIEALRFNNSFEFSIYVQPGVDLSAILVPPMVIQPFIENAIWHGLLLKEGKRRLEISARQKNGSVEVTVEDNGIGRAMAGRFNNRELRRKSFGIDITSGRIGMLKDAYDVDMSIEVEDKTQNKMPAGTTVRITIKPQKKSV